MKCQLTIRKSVLNYSVLLILLLASKPAFSENFLKLDNAVISLKTDNENIFHTAGFLQEQIFIRTGISIPIQDEFSKGFSIVISLGLEKDMEIPDSLILPVKQESFIIWVDPDAEPFAGINLCGRDDRGLLFAAAYLIRNLYLKENFISIPESFVIAEAPADELRAQQILNNTQSNDGFMDWESKEDLKNHIDEMLLAGTNGFETTEPELIDDYLERMGIDLFIKLKCQEIIDLDTMSDEEIIGFYKELNGIDHITTYGGDASGAVKPQLFFPHMNRVLPLLLKGQPGAKWWYSNQCLEDHAKSYDDYIFNFFQKIRPAYLYGMVYGPWTRGGISDTREKLPSRYFIRHFPEICHPRWCQYPVPEWDRILAVVWPRNHSIYMMPTMMRDIYLANRTHTIGSLPYNHTGTYNDLNKFVWSYAGWNPEASVDEILKVYARLFFAYDFKEHPERTASDKLSKEEFLNDATNYVTVGLKLLEQNWIGPLKDNKSVEEALKYWQTIADCVGGPGNNWRVEMFLYKARIDAQIKRKYDFEAKLQNEALSILHKADEIDLEKDIQLALQKLKEVDSLFQSKDDFLKELNNMGLSNKFGDLHEITDNIYSSFNDRYWLEDNLKECRSRKELAAILQYADPGKDGFYDNLGVAGEQAHLVGQYEWAEDPGFIHSPIEWVDPDKDSRHRHSQLTHALTRYETPLEMKWSHLDDTAEYEIRVVYNGPFDIKIKCRTDDGYLIHDFIKKSGNDIRNFNIPKASTSDGELVLQWTQDVSDIMRGVSVSEIWLSKKKNNKIKNPHHLHACIWNP